MESGLKIQGFFQILFLYFLLDKKWAISNGCEAMRPPLALNDSLQLIGTSVPPKRGSEPGMECGKTRLKFPSKCLWIKFRKSHDHLADGHPWKLKKKRMASVFRAKTDGSSFLRDFTVLALFKKHCLKTWSNLDLSRIPHHPTWKWEKVSPAHTSKKDLEYIENAQCSMLKSFSH